MKNNNFKSFTTIKIKIYMNLISNKLNKLPSFHFNRGVTGKRGIPGKIGVPVKTHWKILKLITNQKKIF